MSDTTAFLAGCAVTGFAAVFLLRVGLPFDSPQSEPVQSSPAITQQSPLPVPPSASEFESEGSSQLRRELERQQAIAQALEDKLDDQESTIEKLESRLQDQETEVEKMTAQLQQQQQTIEDITVRRANDSLEQNSPQSGVLWMMGGLVLVLIVGGSVVFICVIIVLLLPQRQPPRNTTHIIHQPPNIPPSYPYVEQQFLPPAQPRTRRTDYIDYNG